MHEDDTKLIGIYATKTDASRARQRAAKLQGFKEHPNGFLVDEYEVGKDHWSEGFTTLVSKTKPKTARTNGCSRC